MLDEGLNQMVFTCKKETYHSLTGKLYSLQQIHLFILLCSKKVVNET